MTGTHISGVECSIVSAVRVADRSDEQVLPPGTRPPPPPDHRKKMTATERKWLPGLCSCETHHVRWWNLLGLPFLVDTEL
jgi:hypothetical protein